MCASETSRLDELLRVVHDIGVATETRLAALRQLGEADQEADLDRATEAVLRLACDQGLERQLSHEAGRVLAKLAGEDTVTASDLTADALAGFNDEFERIGSAIRGNVVSIQRLSDSETRRNVRIALGWGQTLDARLQATLDLGNASANEELFATEALVRLAKSNRLDAGLSEAAGRGFARLRLRQGILDEVHVPYFTEAANSAYYDEAKLLRDQVDNA